MNSSNETIRNPENESDFIKNVFDMGCTKLSQYRPISVIGLSKNGDIRFCRYLDDNQPIALKTIHKCLIHSESEATQLCNHLNWLMTLDNPFILHIRDIFQDEKNVYILSDFCAGGSLYGMLQTFTHLTEKQVKFIAIQLIAAIQYLHSNNCLISSLLAENVLFDSHGYIRLTGFSSSIINCEFPYYQMIGYMEYMSPEMLLNKGIDYSYDWYALGCLLYELIEGTLPFHGDTSKATLQTILIGKVHYKYASSEAQRFINSLLEPQPEKRLGSSYNALKYHEWLKDMPWDNIRNQTFPSPLIRINKTDDAACFFPHYKEDIIDEGDNPIFYNNIFVYGLK